MAAETPDRWRTVEDVSAKVASGAMTLPVALYAVWDAAREAERIDNLRMQHAEREAARLRRASRRGTKA